MSSSIFRYAKHSPTLHQPESMRVGFVWWRKIPGFLQATATESQRHLLRNGSPKLSHSPSDRLTWHVKDRSITQIPIVYRLS